MSLRLLLPIVALGGFFLATIDQEAQAETPPQDVTYARHIKPILDRECLPCHQQGESAPFSLDGYENARKWAKMSAYVTKSLRMPPFKASEVGVFHDERRLTEAEILMLQAWEANGAPSGYNATEAHYASRGEATPTSPTQRWPLGKPDDVISLPKPYESDADGPDEYRYFTIKNPYNEVKWLRAVHPQPGNSAIVHHMTVYLDNTGVATQNEKLSRGAQPGYTSMGGPKFRPSGVLGLWAPGMEIRPMPEGTALALRPGQTMVVLVHYTSSGKVEKDHWKIGMYFTDPPRKEVRLDCVENPTFMIPGGKADHHVKASLPVPQDSTLHSVMPHLHSLGHTFQSDVVMPNGQRHRLISITDWDPAWQSIYWYKTPVKLPRGSRIEIDAGYNNSESNPRNPFSPPRTVRSGEQTTDEMCTMMFMYTVDAEHLADVKN